MIVLCKEETDIVSINVTADIQNGKLTLNGQDIGPVCQEIWGSDEYEYIYRFDKENTKKLIKKLKSDAEPADYLEIIKTHYSGVDGCKLIREFSVANDIKYDFTSY